MGELVEGDDGLLAEVVGVWAKEKHNYLCRYIDISRGVRRGFNGPTNAGATYIDLFCGTGRCVVDSAGEWIDGSAVAAWKKSVEVGAPFTRVYIADKDKKRRDAMEARLRKAGAPVQVVEGSAVEAAAYLVPKLNKHALHFAFLDPYSLRALDFGILRMLSDLKRIDMLVHVSQSDLLVRPYAADSVAEHSADPRVLVCQGNHGHADASGRPEHCIQMPTLHLSPSTVRM